MSEVYKSGRGVLKVLHYIIDNPRCTRTQIQDDLSMKYAAVARCIVALTEENFIEKITDYKFCAKRGRPEDTFYSLFTLLKKE